jgi:hypothetical protein
VTGSTGDPVLARREQIRRFAELGQRIGYLLFGAAIVVFLAGLVLDFTETVATLIVVCLIVGSLVLAPAIVLGYAVRAADKEDAGGP